MLRCLRFTTSGTHYYYHPDTRPKHLSPARRLSDLLLLPPQVAPREKRKKIRYKFSAFFVTPTLAAPCGVVASARLCCLRVCLRPSVLRCWRALLLCVLPLCNLFPRTYIRRRLIPYYDSGPLHKHQIYMRPIFHMSQGVESLGGRLVNLLLPVGQRTDL